MLHLVYSASRIGAIEGGHKKFKFLIFPIKTMDYIDKIFFEQNICPVIPGSGNIRSLAIRRRNGNGWGPRRRGRQYDSRPFEASPVSSGQLLVYRKAPKQTAGHQFSKVKQSVMMSGGLNSRKSIPAQGIGKKLKGLSIDQSLEPPGRLRRCTSTGAGGPRTDVHNPSMAPGSVRSGDLYAPGLDAP